MTKGKQALGNNGATWVLKIGSSLVADGSGLSARRLDSLCEQITQLRRAAINVVIVSSGSISEGMHQLGLDERPHDLPMLQTAAAVGQMGLTHAYAKRFQEVGFATGMVLLTHEDLKDRERYLNARSTIETCLKHDVIPVINENDSVSTDEIRFGDNDTLAARVAALIQADALVVLTDQEGLFEADPRVSPSAKIIKKESPFNDKLDEMVNSEPGPFGRGGMLTKLEAARFAAKSGCDTWIVDGRAPDTLVRLLKGNDVGTHLTADITPVDARKQWIAGQLRSRGELTVDEGAARALMNNGVSLLPIGVKEVTGHFHRGDVVTVLDVEGNEIAKGLSNYSDQEAQKISGHASSEIEGLLGYMDEPEMIHRDNLALI
ncbi:MAG: glutamate 5-kinase [Gammaproteobacteria bacterium]|nr:glutamate 5-kinase [Gammaproteobacteria bacterium]